MRRKRLRKAWITAAALAAGLLALGSHPAQAETCNADKTICLLSEHSPQHPMLLPAQVTVRVPGATLPMISWSRSDLAEPRATGGFLREEITPDFSTHPPRDVVQATLQPGPGLTTSSPADGQITMHVEAQAGYNSCLAYQICTSLTADFPLWVIAPVADMGVTLRRQGRAYVATLGFTGRATLGVEFRFGIKALSSWRCGEKRCSGVGELPGTIRWVKEPAVAPGRHEVTRRLPLGLVERKCRYRQPCEVSLTAHVLRADGLGLGSFERSLGAVIRKKPKRGRAKGAVDRRDAGRTTKPNNRRQK